jgi:hypothetical protein
MPVAIDAHGLLAYGPIALEVFARNPQVRLEPAGIGDHAAEKDAELPGMAVMRSPIMPPCTTPRFRW